MQQVSFQFGNRQYSLSYQKSGGGDESYIYNGTIHISKSIEFSCMKLDESAVFITTPVTLSNLVERAIFNAITHNKLTYE